MKKIYSVLFLAFLVLSSISVNAQSYWKTNTGSATGKIITDKAVARQSFPKEFRLFDLNITPLHQELFSVANQSRQSAVISLPNAEGQMEQFEVFEASNFEPALQARFPEIRAFSGKGITDRYATLKLSISPQGIQGMVFRTDKDNEFIEPYSQDHTVYAVFKSQRVKGQLPWTCSTDDRHMASVIASRNPAGSNFTESSAGQLKTMRLAQSVTAEYSNYFGATSAAQVGLVLAAINNTLTRCNGVYEKDLALHLNLIASTTDVIYYDAATDPYSNAATGAGGAWNGQLQATLTSVIGDANYDIGHLFGASGGGGNAGCIGCVCGSGKGSGFTSPADAIPAGDNFDIDYVVHEVGHQLGANHTFSMSLEGSGVNKEVGSGITIMGYAGITNQDVAPHSIDIYHETSIEQIQNNLATKSCPVTTSITANNATPVVAPLASWTIPITTPFALTGTATDANPGDALTYCWEQNDNSPVSGNASVASPTKAAGPNWLSFSPTASGTRLMPKLSTILAGLSVTPVLPGGDAIANIEALSSVARTLNFRLTVRDNSPYVSTGAIKVGQTAFADMTVTVSSAVGPFLITTQNSAVSYTAGSTQTVTWSVNGTTGAPTNTANVKISWSSDGGLTFPTVLAASTANDGTENITIPAGTTTTGRIKVEAIGNIYFDINNANITVTPPVNDFVFGTSVATPAACPATTATATVPTTVTGTFVTPIVLAATAGVPAGTTVTFAPNPLTPGSSAVATLNNAGTLSAGTYTVTVTGTAGTTIHTTTVSFVISAGAAPVITTAPTAQTVCAPATATFTVASSTAGVTYQWQSGPSATGPFTNIAGATSASYTTAATTAAMSGTFYQVIVSTQCGTVTTTPVSLTVNTAAVITTQPANQSACTGSSATFTVVATGTGTLTYQWQSGPSATGPWTNTGTNSASYNTGAITGTTPAFYHVIVTSATCPGTVTSNSAQLTISTTTAITTAPAAQTVCAPAAATFSVTAAGTGNTYQWQSGPSATGPFTNIAGATSASYTTAATTAAMSGTFYQVVITGSCNTVTSTPVSLTVNTAAAITSQPVATTVCNGTPATFTVGATGTGVTYQWYVSTAAVPAYTAIAGATSATLTLATTTPAMNGNSYRVVVTTTTCAGSVTSNNVILTVNTVANIGTQPTAQSACVPNTATFTVAATGTGLTYQWQVAQAATPSVFVDIPGATAASYTTPPTAFSMNGNVYRVSILSTCAPTTPIISNTAVLTVNNPVSVTQNPIARSGCAGDNFTFSVTATSGGTISYQWQVSTNGGTTYTNIPGATSSTYTVANPPINFSGYLYRVIVSGVPCGLVTTPGAALTLSNRPQVVLTAANGSVNPISTNPAAPSGLYATVSPVGNYVYSWKRDGVILPVTTSSITPANGFFDAFGAYQVTVTDVSTGCTSQSNIVTVSDIPSQRNRLFVYPNPTRGMVHISYYSSVVTAQTRMVNVYDSKGARIMTKAFAPVGTYGQMPLDMTGLTAGIYMIELRDASGKKLASEQVIKNN